MSIKEAADSVSYSSNSNTFRIEVNNSNNNYVNDNKYKLSIRNIDAWFGTKQALKNITLDIKERSVTAFIGPSGCGKTTLIRCINRMHEMTPGAYVKGQLILDGIDIYDKIIDPVIIKRRIGMVFQKPNPFPTMSIYDNVAAGLKLNGIKD